MTAVDITDRLRSEFRVRDWWPGMDSFDSARGETVPHPLAEEAAAEIASLRSLVNELGLHLVALCNHPANWEDRYNLPAGRPCPGCYDARDRFEAWAAAPSGDEESPK